MLIKISKYQLMCATPLAKGGSVVSAHALAERRKPKWLSEGQLLCKTHFFWQIGRSVRTLYAHDWRKSSVVAMGGRDGERCAHTSAPHRCPLACVQSLLGAAGRSGDTHACLGAIQHTQFGLVSLSGAAASWAHDVVDRAVRSKAKRCMEWHGASSYAITSCQILGTLPQHNICDFVNDDRNKLHFSTPANLKATC